MMMITDMARDDSTDRSACLAASATVDADHTDVRRFAERVTAGATDDRTRAVRLYYAVRDGIRYDPYGITLDVEDLRASTTLERGRGWCVAKAVLLAAGCRAVGIPARLGFADVRNHLSTERMRRSMQTDVFYWHGYTSILLGDRWLKATPAFNVELCEKFTLAPLEFDGITDSLFHAFTPDGKRHMEYLRYRDEYVDVPIDAVRATFAAEYAGTQSIGDSGGADFDEDVEAEVRK
jgi:transglutaminase-like putative cysteine protease